MRSRSQPQWRTRVRLKTLVLTSAALLTLSVVSGCEHGSVSDACLSFAPIYPTVGEVDRLSDSLVYQIIEHNSVGQRLCGWSPPTS